jgi:hypothetical protein
MKVIVSLPSPSLPSVLTSKEASQKVFSHQLSLPGFDRAKEQGSPDFSEVSWRESLTPEVIYFLSRVSIPFCVLGRYASYIRRYIGHAPPGG